MCQRENFAHGEKRCRVLGDVHPEVRYKPNKNTKGKYTKLSTPKDAPATLRDHEGEYDWSKDRRIHVNFECETHHQAGN